MLDKSNDSNKLACDATLSRKEFLTKLVQRAAVAGSLIAAPKVIDKFLVPPAQAINSTTTVHDTSNAHDNTQHFHDTHAPLRPPGRGPYIQPFPNDDPFGRNGGGITPSSTPSNNRKTPGFDPDSGWG